MTVKTILACLVDQASAPVLSDAAAALAKRFDAHLTGLHALEAIVVYPGITMHVPGPTFEYFNAVQKAEGDAIGAIFKDTTQRYDIAWEWRMVQAGAAAVSDLMIESARAADLVVMAQPGANVHGPHYRNAFARVVREGGRPVLLVPPGGLSDGGAGRRVIVAHAPTREAARSVFEALPLLEDESEIHILHAGDQRDELRDAAMTDLAKSLARHGAKVTLTHRACHDRTVAKVLTDEAAEVGADLIVAGAFGHSRTYDFFVGATTGELMRSAEVPVLFST